jgi:hypothetical protein
MMATRKPVVYCPICGNKLEFEPQHVEPSARMGKTHWLVKSHTCPAEKVQEFVNGLGIDAEVVGDTDGSSSQDSTKQPPYTKG